MTSPSEPPPFVETVVNQPQDTANTPLLKREDVIQEVTTQQKSEKPKVGIPAMPVVVKKEKTSPYRVSPKEGEVSIDDYVSRAKDENLVHWYERLKRFDVSLSNRVNTSIREHAEGMENLYRSLLNQLERPCSEMEFHRMWTLTMRMFAESPAGGLLANRIYRGKTEWSLGHEKYLHFESLTNLIDASNRFGSEYVKFVNEKLVLKGLSGDAQGRLGIFYRHFNR